MKRKQLLGVLLSLAMLLSLLLTLGITLSAEEPTPTVSIDRFNLSFEDNIYIKYAVALDGVDANTLGEENFRLLFWTSPHETFEKGTEASSVSTSGYQTISGKLYYIFAYTDLAAKQMTDDVYARAYVNVDGEVFYSDVEKYSILQYAYNKLGYTGTASTNANLKTLLGEMLSYGAAAQTYFGYKTDRLATERFYQVSVTNGTLTSDGMTHGLFLTGETVEITAPETSEAVPFSHWVNTSGETVSRERTCTLTVGTANEAYTAVYAEPFAGEVKDGAVTVGNASEFIAVVERVNENIAANDAEIDTVNLNGKINLMGAGAVISEIKGRNIAGLTVYGGESGSTVMNLISSESSFIGSVAAGKTLVIENVVFDGWEIGDYETGSAGIIVGTLTGNLVLRNVTIRNCTVYGQNKVGIIAGQVGSEATITLENVTVENCTVKTSEGEAGKLFGVVTAGATIDIDEQTKVTDTKVVVESYGNHENVTIDGKQYITKVDGNGEIDKKIIEEIEYTRVCEYAADALAWRYPADHSDKVLSADYCGRPAEKITALIDLNTADTVEKANLNADRQLVDRLNTLLDEYTPETFVDVCDCLNQTELTAEDYKPKSEGYIFVWDKSLNKILLVKDGTVVYPEDTSPSKDDWICLLRGDDVIVLDEAPEVVDNAVAVGNASDLITSMQNAAAAGTEVKTMNLSGTVNLLGASTFIPEIKSADKELTIAGADNAVIKNIISTEYANLGRGASEEEQKYASGFVGKVASGETLTVKDVVFDGLEIGDYETGSAGVIVGALSGNLVLRNVTIRNCTVYGQNKVGIIAGQVGSGATITLENVTVENCTVKTSEGEAGKLFGVVFAGATIDIDEQTKVTDTKVVVESYGNHENVTIDGKQYVTKVDGNGDCDTKTIEEIEYIRVCEYSADALAWRYPADHSDVVLSADYCGRPAQLVTAIADLDNVD